MKQTDKNSWLELRKSLGSIIEANGVKCDSEQFLYEDLMELLQTARKEARMETLEQVKKEAKNCIQYDCEVPFVSLSEFTTFFGKLQSFLK